MIPLYGTGWLQPTRNLTGRFTTAPTTARMKLINDTILALVLAGIWPQLQAMWVLAASDAQAASLNWVNPALGPLVVTGTPTFAADRGYTGASNSYLKASFSSALPTNTNASCGAYVRTASTVNAFDFSGYSAANTRLAGVCGRNAGFGNVSDATTLSQVTARNAPKLIGMDKPSAGSQFLYLDGVQDATGAIATAAFPITQHYFLGNDIAGTFSDRQTCFGWIGKSLTAAQHLAMKTIMVDGYLVSIGAA